MALAGITPARINAITVLLDRIFHDTYKAGLDQMEDWASPHARTVNTTKDAVDFIWYGDQEEPEEHIEGQPPEFREFLGYNFERSFQRWRNAIRVKRRNLINDQGDLGILRDQAQDFARKYALLTRYLTVDFLNNGETAAVTTYTGDPLFANTHQLGDGTFDNLFAGTGDFFTDVQTVYTGMQTFESDLGLIRDMNFPTHVIYPPGLFFEIRQTLRNTNDPRDNKNTENINQDLVMPITEPRLTDTNDYFFMRSTPGEVPIVEIENRDLEIEGGRIIVEDQPNSDAVRNHDEIRWWIDRTKGIHPTHPHLWAKVVNA